MLDEGMAGCPGGLLMPFVILGAVCGTSYDVLLFGRELPRMNILYFSGAPVARLLAWFGRGGTCARELGYWGGGSLDR